MENPVFLVGSSAFMEAFRSDCRHAAESIAIQTMTFEMDGAGLQVIQAMKESKAAEKQIILDDYSRWNVNDRFAFGIDYVRDSAFRTEVKRTRELLTRSPGSEINVSVTNPIRGLPWRYPFRNHKKMVVIDRRIVYLGGINISDHNFSWVDLMLRIESDELGMHFQNDLTETLCGRNQRKVVRTDWGNLRFMDGIRSKDDYKLLFASVRNAKQRIDVISPYLSDPLLQDLEAAGSRGISVNLFLPGRNNKPFFSSMLESAGSSGKLNLYHYPDTMSHMKAVLIDEKELWIGSSNYDFASYLFEQEIILQSQRMELIEPFKQQVLNAVKATSTAASRSARTISPIRMGIQALLNVSNRFF